MEFCSIDNPNIDAVLKDKLSKDKYDGTIGVLKDLVQSNSAFNMSGVANEADALEVTKFFNKFIDNNYCKSFVSFIHDQPLLRKVFLKAYNETNGGGVSRVIRSLFSMKNSWDKYSELQIKSDNAIRYVNEHSTFLRNLFILNELITRNGEYQGSISNDTVKYILEASETIESIEETMSKNMFTNVLTSDIKTLLRQFFGHRGELLDLDMPADKFESIIDNLITEAIHGTGGMFANTFISLNNDLNNLVNFDKDGKANFENIWHKRNALSNVLKKNIKTVGELKNFVTKAMIRASFDRSGTNSALLNMLKDRLMSIHKLYHNTKDSNINSATYPWFAKNKITQEAWDNLKSTIGNGIRVRDLLKKNSDNSIVSEFLSNLTEHSSNPIVEIVSMDEIPQEGELRKIILHHQKLYDHVPSAMYVSKYLNKKELNSDYEGIIILDTGVNDDYAFSFAEMTHEYLHSLTMYAFNSKVELGENIEKLRQAAIRAYNYGKINLSGIDTNKLDIITENGRLMPYAFTSGPEFVSEAFNNTELQKLLDRINSPFKSTKRQSIWKWLLSKIQGIINNILDSVGHKKGTNTILSELLITGGVAMQLNTTIKKKNNEDFNYNDDLNYIMANTENGVYVSPTKLDDLDRNSDVLKDCPTVSSADKAILSKCNTVITPSMSSARSSNALLYIPNEDFVNKYNNGVEDRSPEAINNTSFNSRTIAHLDIKNDLSGFGVKRADEAISNAYSDATRILNLGGRVITYSKDYINNNLLDNRYNLQMYNRLLSEGYKPHSEGNMTVWTQDKITEEEKKEFLLDAERIDKLNPNIEIENDTCIIHPTIDIAEGLKTNTNKIVVKSDNPLFDKFKLLNVGTRVRIHSDKMYYGAITAISELKNGSIVFNTDLQVSEYTDFDVQSFDLSEFERTSEYEIKDNQDVNLVLGAEKASWRVSMIAQHLIWKLRAKLMDVKLPDEIGIEDNEQTRLEVFFASNSFDSICNTIKQEYEDYINYPEYRLEMEIDNVNDENERFDIGWDEDTVVEKASERAEANLEKYRELMPYFDILAKKAARRVASTFGINLTYYTDGVKNEDEKDSQESNMSNEDKQTLAYDANTDNIDDADYSNDVNDEAEIDSDIVGKDHWVTSSSNQDIHETVNIRIRKVLSGVLKSNYDGSVMRDDMFNILYEDEREVFNVILGVCSGLQSIGEMLDAIEDYASDGHPNYYTIVDTIRGNQELESLFFTGICSQKKRIESCVTVEKEDSESIYVHYANKDAKYDWIEKSVQSIATAKTPNTVFSLLGSKITIDTGVNSVQLKNITKYLADFDVDNVKIKPKIMKQLLFAVGIDLSEEDIMRSVNDNEERYADIVIKVKDIVNAANDSNDKRLDYDDYGSLSRIYKDLAVLLADAIPVSQQVRTYCEGKLYPTYNKPSYISKALDTLSNLNNTNIGEDGKTDRKRYMDKEYKRFSQYYTKNNLFEMINSAKKMAVDDDQYFSLVDYLESLEEVSERQGDKEVSERLSHLSITNPELIDLISNLYDRNGNILTFTEGKWNYTWLEDLYTMPYVGIEMTDMLSFDGKPYNKMSERDYLDVMFTKFRSNNSKRIAITVPIYADANCWNFMYCKPQGSIDKIVEGFKRIMESEINRVKCVIDRYNLRIKAIEKFNNLTKKERMATSIGKMDGFTYPIPNYDINGRISYKKDGTIDLDAYIADSKKSKNRSGLNYQYFQYSPENGTMEDQILSQLNEEFDKFVRYAENIYKKTDKKTQEVTYPGLPDSKMLKAFFFEHCYAVAQIHAITSMPVFYKNAIDFQKRFKEVYALTTRLNVDAEGGRRFERSIGLCDRILNDFVDMFKQTVGSNIDKILKNAKHLTPATKIYIKKKLKEINATDAQGIRTPSSYIAIKKMLGEWGSDSQRAWSALNSGQMTLKDFRLLMGVIKPFVRSSYSIDSKTPYGDIKVPVQHKNSEVMSTYGRDTMLVGAGRKEQILAALTDFMEDNCIDIANFESAIKVGNQAPIDLNECNSYDDAMSLLYKSTGIDKSESEEIRKRVSEETGEPYIFGNPEVIKTIPYSDWGVVAPNPEHFTDKRMKIGSQIRRVMKSDIISEDEYEFVESEWEYKEEEQDGKNVVVAYRRVDKPVKMSGADVIKEYDKPIKDNLSISYKKLEELFGDKDKLAAFLDETITNDDKLPDELKELLKRDEYGNFTNLADPSLCEKIHQILMSKVRKTITEQKIAGGTCVQVSCMWDNGLSLHFKEDSDGNTIIDYADCYLPCYMKSLYAFCINEDGFLDLEQLKRECIERKAMDTYEALTTMIGYRTPTEGVSSAIPLRIKGFLPPVVGSCVVLPKEITFLSGSDFDVDKLYIMRHEFTFDRDGFPIVAKGYNTKGNNNKLVDMMLGLMMTKQYAEKFFNPSGSFDDLKKSVGIINILNNTPANSISIDELRKLDPDAIDDYIKDNNIKIKKDSISLLSPQFQSYYHEQNFSGKNLLAVWAVYKSAIDLLQYCHIQVSDKYSIKYNGKTLRNLCPQFIKDGKTDVFLTQVIKQYLAASADNTKDPVQFKLGITEQNVQAVAYLSLMGLDSTSVALIIRAANMCTKDVADIKKGNIANSISQLSDKTLSYPNNDTIEAAALLMRDATIAGKNLNDLVSILREDSQKGALKNNIYKTLSFGQKINYVISKINRDVFYVPKDSKLLDVDSEISSSIQNESLVGNVQQFYDYGVRSYFVFARDMFPEFNDTFQDAYSLGMITRNGYMSENNCRDITEHLYYYHIMSLPFFKESSIESYKENMPKYFKSFMADHPELTNNQFLKRLQVRLVNGLDVVTLPKAFQYERETSNIIKNAFLDLFRNEDRDIRVFAWNLLKYSIYRQGFKKKSDGYGHFITRNLLNSIPGYKQLMQKLQNGEIDNGSFKIQFLQKGTSITNALPVISIANDKSKESKNAKILNALINAYDLNMLPRPEYFVCKNRKTSYVYETSKICGPDGYTVNDDYKGFEVKPESDFISYDTEGFNIDLNVVKRDAEGVALDEADTKEVGYFAKKEEERDNDASKVC